MQPKKKSFSKKKKKSNKKITFNLENNYIEKILIYFWELMYKICFFFIIINDYLEFKLMLSTL